MSTASCGSKMARKRAVREGNDPLIVYPARNKKAKKESGAKGKEKNLMESKKKNVVEIVEEEGQEEVKVARSIPETTRRYQLEILDVAISRNTIVVLETGTGKTLIAVLLIKQIANKLRDEGEKGIIVFLAPTVQLVAQQSDVIKYNTDLQVGCYHGAKDINIWNAEKWKREVETNEVLVMTPQILLDGLRLNLLKLDMVHLLIFDECHHACGHHPYAKIMKESYYGSQHKPKIFGMTASPVMRKGVSSSVDCEDQIARLEDILDSKVYTLKDRAELDLFVPTPKQVTKFYRKHHLQDDSLRLKLASLREKNIQSELFPYQFKDEENFMKKMRKRIWNLHGNIEYCLENLGLYGAYKATQLYLAKDSRHNVCDIDTIAVENVQESRDAFLYDVLELLEEALPADVDKLFKEPTGITVAVERGILSQKVQRLVQLLLQHKNAEEMHCIIFVERVIVAAVMSSLMQQIDCLSFVISDYLSSATPVLGRKKQQKTLDLFSAGTINVLVATDVVEEGIDVQGCRCVIRFDLPKTVRSFIQSRGRARQSGSYFILLVESDNEKQQQLLFDIIKSEESLREMAMDRNHTPRIQDHITIETDVYFVESTGATINCDASISFIYKYCAKLPGDTYYSPRPEFISRKVEGLYQCILKLPPNAPFHEVISPLSAKLLHAKQLACLEACKSLHKVGAVNDYLQPVTEVLPEEEDIMNSYQKICTDAGTTKRKELHSTVEANTLFGSWGEEQNVVTLQVYKLVFSSDFNNEETYTNFALLIEAVLDDDVATAEIDLHLTAGRVVKSKLVRSGEVKMDQGQLKDAKAFQEILCNGVFGKLMRRNKGSKGSNILKEHNLKIIEMKDLWSSSEMYLLLPLESEKSGFSESVASIDWKCIRNCASGARLFKLLCTISEKDNNIREALQDILMERTTLLQCAAGKSELISLASGTCGASELIDKVVITVHSGKIYSIVEVIHDKTVMSPFPGYRNHKADNYGSYCDYFNKKYGKKLKHLNQPLLRVKQTHRPHNLLTHQSEKLKERSLNSKVDEVNYVELPPELCLDLGIQTSVIKSLYFLPSVMHRLSSLMLASQLRKTIREDLPKCPIVPAALIMEAVTTARCLESFSYERLELLGDSFLKYSISRYLFLKYEKNHEGQLSAHRSRAISNATLHRLAIFRDLPKYIQDEPFDACRWVAPGMLCWKSVPCHCNPKKFESNENPSIEKENKVVRIGKACDEGHRWMCSKTISDVVESLIGAYLVGGGPIAALEVMKWMNMEVEVEAELLEAAFDRAFVYPCVLRSTNLHGLEVLLRYEFKNKALLVEALTHASQQDPEGGGCYQRLEFLGDSLLDFLITFHLYSTYPRLSPGILTNLRSAAVNNQNFARVAVKQNIQKYLRHGSGTLLNQITDFVKDVGECKVGQHRFISFGGGIGGPKVLGDLVESIAGAILVDTKFNLACVWEIMKPILSPIVTPETLDLHPLRELQELCCQHGFSLKWKFVKRGKLTVATAEVQLEESLIVATGSKMNKKTAKMVASQQMLTLLEMSMDLASKVVPEKGSNPITCGEKISVSENNDFKKSEDKFSNQVLATDNGIDILKIEQTTAGTTHLDTGELDMDVIEDQCWRRNLDQEDEMHRLEEGISLYENAGSYRMDQESDLNQEPSKKRQKLLETSADSRKCEECISGEKNDNMICNIKDSSNQNWCPDDGLTSSSKVDGGSNILEAWNSSATDSDLVSLENVGAKPAFIQKLQVKGVARNLLYHLCLKKRWPAAAYHLIEEIGLPHIRSFMFDVHIPQHELGHIKIQGEAKSDKKSAKDSASLMMLHELEKQGLCVVDDLIKQT
ncbi:endoribonuclease Dicer homolog 3b isoform X2 [Cryptomeria japonica]|uniref:endoribonuclease Dicer homolog 3b isoform X2 n=1 Tax=Cryptomeria japonica TaxID=3369 RepID=UPI0027D9CF50|nr:endoribonuclease Dicer homolog 3b isoform X2 [Cryptomeria japonica]